MKSSRTLSAFSLPEMLITLSLTAVTIGLGQQIYQALLQSEQAYQHKLQHCYEASRIQKRLTLAFRRAYVIQFPDSQHCRLLNQAGELSQCFQANGQSLILNHRDTIHFPCRWKFFNTHMACLQDIRFEQSYCFKLPVHSGPRIIHNWP